MTDQPEHKCEALALEVFQAVESIFQLFSYQFQGMGWTDLNAMRRKLLPEITKTLHNAVEFGYQVCSQDLQTAIQQGTNILTLAQPYLTSEYGLFPISIADQSFDFIENSEKLLNVQSQVIAH